MAKKLSQPQQNMVERLKAEPKERLKTTNRNEIRTLEALKRMGLVVQLWGPTPRNPESLYALVNERRSY